MKRVIYFILALVALCSTITHAALLNIKPETVEAEAWTILDPQSGQVIAEHNSHLQRAPASLTKMMVAYITLKEIQAGHLRKDEVLTATPVVKLVQWDESQMYLKEGDQITIHHLLAGLVVMSANDAAVTLAERISGSVPKFVERMNKEAKALGMNDSHFENPPGVTMPEHYSSAADLARLGAALVKEVPDYLTYSKQQSFSYNGRFHRATNILLKQDPSVDGLKTGFTRAAGYNLALTASRPTGRYNDPDRRLIVVVLGTKSGVKRAEVAHKLMNLAYVYTRNEVAVKDKTLLAEVPVIKSTLKMFKVETKAPQIISTALVDPAVQLDLANFDPLRQRIAQDLGNGQIQVLEPLQQTNTNLEVKMNEKLLTAPLSQVMKLATIEVYQNNQLINSFDIEDDVQIEEAGIFQRFFHWLSSLFGGSVNSEIKTYPIGK
ncbi:D-alanyl-D-alanine carboxypeptidase [Acinetobacter cumulans]|uniref:D-alanyl-D-alanine carboxypeptidase n=1 Tax=Acinetobacter cumulans TaxID=2136182 RepID=A0A498D400_9GAMM|nr:MULTISPECIES: D-alanyl-D-alanine carboxypeptidase family protein [Acinetobacter]RKG41775.1 D-alanyl-D-alanine carboxypeptidase [Acinetobacter cumulans]RLL29909.1 D-alanyl-D-alanine carboxypeptidase [Acinetobacter cumulans]RZG57741.1 D-alanyl-D-alanine carboxypeptidase [Acinetobacter sp. WCHAc060006]